MEPHVEIVNIVAAIKLEPMPDPNEILEKIPGSKPVKRFRGALVRLGRIPVLFYKNKIVITGVRSRGELNNIIRELLRLLDEHQFKSRSVEVDIVNITGYAMLSRELDLPSLAEKIKGIYDPDYRPYLIARINDTTLIISQQGKIVVWGGKSEEEIMEVIKKIITIINYLEPNL